MAYGELIDLNDRRPTPSRGTAARSTTRAARQRMPVIVGILVGSPISLALWLIIIFGLRAFF